MRDLVTTILEAVGIVCMVVAVTLLTSPAWGLLALGAALIAYGWAAS